MIEWELWHSVSKLAIAGSYKAAAARMGVNAATIKRRKEALERSLGQHLFVKQAGLLIPTPACKKALEDIQLAAKHINAARLELGSGREQGHWRRIAITSGHYICNRILGPALVRLPVDRRLRVELVAGDRPFDLMEGREADIALRLGHITPGSLSVCHIADIEYSTFAARGSAIADCPWITLDRSYSHLEELRLAEERAGADGVRYTASSSSLMHSMINTGAAKGILPNLFGDQNANLLVLQDHPSVVRPLWLLWRAELLEEPHFNTILTWILTETGRTLCQTEAAGQLLQKASE